MSFGKLYSSFLVSPKIEHLDGDAGLHYITTCTSIKTNASIVSHLSKQAQLYKKKEEKVLSSVESGNSLVVEVATTLEFVNGGGSLLPGLDDNFLSDQVITAPIIHIVDFENNKIKQIRLYWDQASFLKQIGVIGKTGKNWPIQPGVDQIKAIRMSAATVDRSSANTKPTDIEDNRSRSSTQGTGESLSLFAAREVNMDTPKAAAVAPRSPVRTQSRALEDLLGSGDPVVAQTPKAGAAPKRTFGIGNEISEEDSTPDRKYKGNPKKYDHFEFGDPDNGDGPAAKAIHPKSESMFTANKQKSWDFEDFVTPEKRPMRRRPQEERHFGWSDDEPEGDSPVKQPKKLVPRRGAETHFEFLDDSPEKTDAPLANKNGKAGGINIGGDGMGGKKGVYKHDIFGSSPEEPSSDNLRNSKIAADRNVTAKNMDTHWGNSTSPGTENKPPSKPTGIMANSDGMGGWKGSSKYEKYDIFEDDSSVSGTEAKQPTKPTGIMANSDGMGGWKGSSKHEKYNIFEEDSPVPSSENVRAAKAAAERKVTASNMDTHWSNSTPPVTESKPINKPTGIMANSDGMGGWKGSSKYEKYDIFASSPEKPSSESVRNSKIIADRQTTANNMDTHWSNSTPPPQSESKPVGKTSGGINIGGDGMGGKKGQYKHDIFAEESPVESSYDDNEKQFGNNQKSSNTTRGTGQSAGGFWDF